MPDCHAEAIELGWLKERWTIKSAAGSSGRKTQVADSWAFERVEGGQA